MIKWLHHLLQPHCEHCIELAREARVCNSCESLKLYIARLELEKDRLLNEVLHKPEPIAAVEETELKPILPRYVPFRVRQQELEANDRKKAQLEKQHAETRAAIVVPTNDLENELLSDIKEANANQTVVNKS